jgi:preprotein translocase subunit SecA
MAQKDPLVEYTSEGEKMFNELGEAIREEVVLTLFHAEIQAEDAAELQQHEQAQRLQYEHEQAAGADVINQALAGPGAVPVAVGNGDAPQPIKKSELENIGRNDPCWCGSGKKFKKCHGA